MSWFLPIKYDATKLLLSVTAIQMTAVGQPLVESSNLLPPLVSQSERTFHSVPNVHTDPKRAFTVPTLLRLPLSSPSGWALR